MSTTIRTYRNKRNRYKYIEVHSDGHYHNAVVQFMESDNGVKNYMPYKRLCRLRKRNLKDLLEDYEEV